MCVCVYVCVVGGKEVMQKIRSLDLLNFEYGRIYFIVLCDVPKGLRPLLSRKWRNKWGAMLL